MALPTDTLGPFDVRTDDLIHIDAAQAVELFRQLLVIEAVMYSYYRRRRPCSNQRR